MAFKMKAGKEGPMYKNFGIGKKSPMHIQDPETKKSPRRGPKVGVDDKKYPTGMLKDPDFYKKMGEEKAKEAYGETGKPATVEPKKEITPQTSKDSFKKKSAEEKRRYKESPMPKHKTHMKKSPYKTDNATTTDKMRKRQSASISHQSDFRKQQAAKELARVQAYKDAQKKKQ